jgi:uncharacterized protein
MSEIVPLARKPKKTACPICRRATHPEFRPFCSARCKDEDMRRWLGGSYRIQTDETPDGPPDENT